MKVPLLDLKSQYNSIKKEVQQAFQRIVESQHFILGPAVEQFERAMASYIGTSYAIGVASGSDALLLSLKALKIGPGDEVITTPFSFIATAGSIVHSGARPIFVDIQPDTFNIDPIKVTNYLRTKKTHSVKAIVPVHLYGQCADMDSLTALSRKYNIPLIEDAAQSIGATYHKQKAGSFGAFGCFSFYPTKNLSACGDGGLIVTNDKDLAQLIRTLRNHGMTNKYHYKYIGYNSRLDSVQAAVLHTKLRYLPKWNTARVRNAERYRVLFKKYQLDKLIVAPVKGPGRSHVYHQYTVRVPKKRNRLKSFLEQSGIGVGVYYPIPLHLQDCFRSLGYQKSDLPEAEKAATESLSLPIYPDLTKPMQEYVVSKIADFFFAKSNRPKISKGKERSYHKKRK